MIELCPVLESHAAALFPLVFRTSVVDTLVWNGPGSLEEFQQALREREEQTSGGQLHRFTILDPERTPIGAIDIRPDHETTASIGLWIGAPFHGLGYGTEAVRLIVRRGFEQMNLERIYARVFVGNIASRRIFEKNGFILEGALRHVVRKRGVFLDAWILAILREDYEQRTRHT